MLPTTKWQAGIVLTAAAALVLTGCSASGSADSGSSREKTIGVVYKDASNPYWIQAENGAKAEAKKDGVKLIIQSPTNEQAIQEQIDKIRALITQGVDGLMVSPNSPKQLQPVLEEAVNQGIPVALIDTGIPGWNGQLTTIGTDNYDAGKIAGEYIAKHNKSGNVAILDGLPGNPATDDRVRAFKAAIKGTNIKVVTDLSANSSGPDAVNVMSDMLQAHPDINIVFAPADVMALGAVSAIKTAGLDPKDFQVVGVDGTRDGANSIKSGGLTATVAQYPYKMGEDGVKSMLKKIKGGTVKKRVDTGADLIDSSNVSDYISSLNHEN